MTAALIDAGLDVGGSFYLPYRLHASRAQVARAYPRLEEFVAGKRRYDPACCSGTRCGSLPRMNPLRILAVVYAVLFAVVTSLNYIPGLTDAAGPGRSALRARRIRRRAARGIGQSGPRSPRGRSTRATSLLPRVRHALLSGRPARPGHRLRLPRSRHRGARRVEPAPDHPHPHEPAAHRDRRLRRLRRVRAGAPLGPLRATPCADMFRWAMRVILAALASCSRWWSPCRSSGSRAAVRDRASPACARPAPLVDDRGYRAARVRQLPVRPPSGTSSTPYEDLAGVCARPTERSSAYGGRSQLLAQPLQPHSRRDGAGAGGHDTKVMLYTIGGASP